MYRPSILQWNRQFKSFLLEIRDPPECSDESMHERNNWALIIFDKGHYMGQVIIN